MKAVVNDVIGTTDGRYGTISAVDGDILTVVEAVDINEPCPTEATYFNISQKEVASIV